ncbi:MAG: hypothetical protein OXI63_00915, partial [Candidatus Poribacteria bacterium]|nr:hypothetical protein [Candidatus Poribacteria bacterium]
KGRELFAPIYEYSGKLTPEEQKRFSELFNSIANVEPSVAQKYGLPKRELFQLEVHIMTLYRNNPELPFMGNSSASASLDVESYTPYFSIRALIAKTRLADLPADSRKLILSHLETFKKRLAKNSVEVYMREVRNLPDRPRQKAPPMRFGVASAPGEVGGEWVLEADGLVRPEGAKRGVFQITDIYENTYEVDLDDPADTGITEDTTELYAKIDQIFEQLTDAEFQRLSTLSKADRSTEIEKLFSAE